MRPLLLALVSILLVAPALASQRSCVTCCVEQEQIHTEPCEFSTTHQGNTYFFCKQACLDEFSQDPDLWAGKFQTLLDKSAGKPDELPDFKLPLEPVGSLSRSDLEGKVVLLNMWASWCGPCMEEMPDLIRLQDEFKARDLLVIGFNFDQDRAKHRQTADELGLNFLSIFADQAEVKQLLDQIGPFPSIPVTLVVDRDGRIVHKLVGKQSFERLKELTLPLLPDSEGSRQESKEGSLVPS